MRIIRGKYGRRRFDIPKNITARPTTDFAKENIFNVLENIIDFEGKTACDLFAGTGAISFEFASRGCEKVISVEKTATQYSLIVNIKTKLKDENVKPIKGDVFKFVKSAKGKFDIIFADPPYDHPNFDEVPELILNSDLVGEGTIVIVEHSDKKDFSHLAQFMERRTYGSVNFTIFKI